MTWERGTLVKVLSGVWEGETCSVCVDHGVYVTVQRDTEDGGELVVMDRTRLEKLF